MTQQKQQQGFTIIEVVLVLAIAGLIFLMVFIALPALQRGQRDTERKDNVSKVLSAITNYRSNHNNSNPTISDSFAKYLDGTKNGSKIEINGGKYAVTTSGSPTNDNMVITYGGKCNDTDNEVTTSGVTSSSFAIQIKLENGGGDTYCQDNS